jgi:hypothetical protein
MCTLEVTLGRERDLLSLRLDPAYVELTQQLWRLMAPSLVAGAALTSAAKAGGAVAGGSAAGPAGARS